MAEGDIPENANHHCPGSESESAGKADGCNGCPNQQICSSSIIPKGPDPEIAVQMENVKHKILVMSGKGGVGKSTFSAQLSFSLAKMGFEVGLLDVDICGPSIPGMLGVEGNKLRSGLMGNEPVYVQPNLGVMSIGFMAEDLDDPIILRGPRKTGVIEMFLKSSYWNELDFLIIDTPPGTSDEQISVVRYLQETGIDGAIIVTTPEEVAMKDVRRGISFCHRVGVRVLGVVENKSELSHPLMGFSFWSRNGDEEHDVTEWMRDHVKEIAERHNIYARLDVYSSITGGASTMCSEKGIPFLGKVPLDPLLCVAAREGWSCFEQLAQGGAGAMALKRIIDKLMEGFKQ